MALYKTCKYYIYRETCVKTYFSITCQLLMKTTYTNCNCLYCIYVHFTTGALAT
jgi:hypothetical protein